MAIKRSFILSTGIGVSADNLFVVNNTNSVSSTTGSIVLSGGIGIGQSASISGRLQMFNGANYTSFVSSASGNTVYTLPATSPATGSSVLQSTSAGILSWVPLAASGGTAQNIAVNSAGNANVFHQILFTPSSSSSGSAVSSDVTISFNPSTEILNVSGLAVTATTASTSTTTGALVVTGGAGIGGSIFGGSTISAADNIEIKSGKELRLNNSGNTFYTGIKSGANVSNTTYTFPTALPGAGFSVLQSDTSGTLSWTGIVGFATTSTNINVVAASTSASHRVLFTPASGTASGAAVSSESTFVYNPSTDILSVSGLAITSGTASTSSTTGALIVTGGVGIGGSLHVGTSRNTLYTVTPIAGFAASIPSTASVEILNSNSLGYTRLNLTNNNGNYVSFSLNGSGVANPNRAAIESSANLLIAAETNILHISTSGEHIFDSGGYCLRIGGSGVSVLLTEPSTSSSTGALTVAGGAGIAKTSYFGQSVFIQGTTASGSTTTGALVVSGGAGIAGSFSVGGRLQMFNGANYTSFVSSATGNTVYTLPATSPATGSSVLQSTAAGVMSWVPMTASGNTAQNIVVNTAGNANVFHPILFTPSSLSAGSAVSSDSTISFNPLTEILNVSGLAITSGTASTNTTTGALVVRGGLGVTGQLSFAQASFGFTGITTNPIMSFIGATSSSPIMLTVLTDNSLSFEGSQGSVFSIDSNLSSGEIFSVSDISGLPIISASAGQTVNINEFGGFTQIGNGSINSSTTTTGSLVVSGGLGLTGNANIGGTVRITSTTASTSSSSGALTVSGGAGIAQTLFVGGSISNANYFYSGGNNFTKSGQAQGDILLDNNANDTPGVLYYYKNNTNFGIDAYAVGIGATRLRIVKDLNESGGAELWSIDRTGVVTQTAWAAGEIIKMTVLVGADLTGGSTTTISTTSDTDVASYSYTPVSSNSYLVIEFTTRYFVVGAAADDYVSRIAVDGAEQSYNVQVWTNGAGGGTRSGTLFPLMARYTNSNTTAKTISATVRKGTTDDNATVYKDTTTVMKITEIGR